MLYRAARRALFHTNAAAAAASAADDDGEATILGNGVPAVTVLYLLLVLLFWVSKQFFILAVAFLSQRYFSCGGVLVVEAVHSGEGHSEDTR